MRFAEAATAALLYGELADRSVEGRRYHRIHARRLRHWRRAHADIDFGLASDTHATDFESICRSSWRFTWTGPTCRLSITATTERRTLPPWDTTVDLVDDTFCSRSTLIIRRQFYYGPIGGDYVRVAAGRSTFRNASANWTPIVLIEKTSNDTTADAMVSQISDLRNPLAFSFATFLQPTKFYKDSKDTRPAGYSTASAPHFAGVDGRVRFAMQTEKLHREEKVRF